MYTRVFIHVYRIYVRTHTCTTACGQGGLFGKIYYGPQRAISLLSGFNSSRFRSNSAADAVSRRGLTHACTHSRTCGYTSVGSGNQRYISSGIRGSSSVAISPNNWVTADYYDTLRVQIYYKRVYYYVVRENATENVWSPWPSHRITADNASRTDANSRPWRRPWAPDEGKFDIIIFYCFVGL